VWVQSKSLGGDVRDKRFVGHEDRSVGCPYMQNPPFSFSSPVALNRRAEPTSRSLAVYWMEVAPGIASMVKVTGTTRYH